jgi:iron complex outermembrane receptor protein
VNLYARVATGFRAPSFGAPSAGQAIQVAQSEDNTSYEGGVKADLFDRMVRVSLDGFYYDVSHQQLTAVGGASNQTALLNARKTIGDGVEADLWVHPTPNLTLTAAGSYNHTKIEDPTLAVGVCAQCTVLNAENASGNALINGNPLPQAAKWIGDFSLNYTYPVGPSTNAYFFSDIAYRSGVNFFLYESKEFDGPALFQLGLRLGVKLASGKYDVAVFCRNCTNQIVAIGGIDFDDNTGMINDPRIVGLQFTDRF